MLKAKPMSSDIDAIENQPTGNPLQHGTCV